MLNWRVLMKMCKSEEANEDVEIEDQIMYNDNNYLFKYV